MLDTEEDQSKVDEKFDELVGRGFTPDEIAEMEKNATEVGSIPTKSVKESGEQSQVESQIGEPDFFRNERSKNSSKGRFGAFLSRNRGKTTIGLGALLLTGGGFGLFAMLAGPLQFVQIAKLLQGFHFSSQEDLSDDRMMKIARYIRYKDSPEKLRLGYLGNKYADSIERRMNKSGVKSSYTDLGYGDGYIIDLNNIPEGSDLDTLNSNSPEDFKQKLSSRYDIPIDKIDLDVSSGRVWVSSDGLGYFNNKKLVRAVLQDSGYSKIGSAIRARIMGKRAGIDWHPIKKLDKKVLTTLDARLKKWAVDRENRIISGVQDNPSLTAENNSDIDGDGTPDSTTADIDEIVATANDIAADPPQVPDADLPSAKVEAKVSSIKGKLGKAAGVSGIIGIVCLAEGLASGFDDAKQAKVVLPLVRMGVEGVAVGNQIMTGQDIDLEQLGALSGKLYSDEDGSWASARSIQAELGKELTGPDIGAEARISNGKNVLSEIFSKIPGLSGVCEVANSVIGQIVTTGLDLFTGPVGAATGLAFTETLGKPLLDSFARWIAGNPINLNVAGANYGNYINYGARLAANDSIIASGGVELNPEQSLELKQHRLESENEELQNKGFFARLFDPTDTRSIVGDFMSKQSPDPAKNIARVANSVPSSMASIFKLPFIGTKKASAATIYDYGFSEYGYSITDINDDKFKNPFENGRIVDEILRGSKAVDYRKRAAGCFGVSIQSDGAVRSIGKAPAYHEMPSDCKDEDDDWKRVRFFILDSQLMEAYACYENDDTACAEFGLSNAGGSSSNQFATVNTLDCEGYEILTSLPAVIVDGDPTNTNHKKYPESVRSICETRKNECISGVIAESQKALCAAFEFDRVYYGSTSYKASGQEYYGFTAATNALNDPANWYSKRQPGLNPYNVLECSALTTAAVYRAFNYSSGVGCSSKWTQRTHPELFRDITASEILPGDFLTRTPTCRPPDPNDENDIPSHIAIAASPVDASGNIVVYHSSGHGSTVHFQKVKLSFFLDPGGRASRWIGPTQ